MSGMLSNGQIVTTLLNTDVTVTINTSGVYIDNALVTVADIIADNGVVHVIDAVLLPNPGCTDPNATNYDSTAIIDDGSCVYATNKVYDVVVTSADHSLLELAIDTCGLGGTLSGSGPFTLFAPTDAAFNALGSGTLLSLLKKQTIHQMCRHGEKKIVFFSTLFFFFLPPTHMRGIKKYPLEALFLLFYYFYF